MEALEFDRTLTHLDHMRLTDLVRRAGDDAPTRPSPATMRAILESASVVPPDRLSPDVVTMNSQVLVEDIASRRQRKLTLCYPQDAEPAAGFISVLSPVGSSLLGLHVGATARWRTPLGGENTAEVLAVLFQPEAVGDYTL
jgi:regulator of nucleoside diphosphate kinase